MEPLLLLTIIAILAGGYLAFNIGANDVANTMGTSVGSKALTIKRAILLAAVFEFLGAFLIGDEVSKTIKNGFVSPEIFANDPQGFAYGMTAAILAAALWLQYATIKGLPVSTTHSIVGSVLGFAIAKGGLFEIDFSQLLGIFSSWIISPLLGGIISYLTLRFILRAIIDKKNPIRNAKRIVPLMIGLAVAILSSAFSGKLVAKVNDDYPHIYGTIAALALGLVVAVYFRGYLSHFAKKQKNRDLNFQSVESVFAKMQLITACFLAFAHGSNDVANAIGPAAAVISALTNNTVSNQAAVPVWLLLLGALGIVLGLWSLGRKVIHTVGKNITEITPTRGFAAEFGASLTILFGTILGLPLSTTHILVGSVIGVGVARGIGGVDILVIKRIWRSWFITMPATCALSIVFCLVLKLF